jgi:hypothetical protein
MLTLMLILAILLFLEGIYRRYAERKDHER